MNDGRLYIVFLFFLDLIRYLAVWSLSLPLANTPHMDQNETKKQATRRYLQLADQAISDLHCLGALFY